MNICHSGIDGHIGSVGLGGCGQQHSGLRQRDARLRQTELHGGIHTGLYDGDGLWIGQADVLRCNDQQTAARRKQIPGLQQATQVMHRSIGIGAADGFLQGGEKIIVLVALPVIPHGTALGGLFRILQRNDRPAGGCHSAQGTDLQRIGRFSYIPAAAGGNMGQRPLLHL